MINFIYLRGIVKNISYSHTIGDTTFKRAEMIVGRNDCKEDLIIVKFKDLGIYLKEGQELELMGSIRSYSQAMDGKNRVEIYVFSYLDVVEVEYENSNIAILEGRICKKDTLRRTPKGKHYIHFIVANNIITDDGQKLNSYIPCVSWGKNAKKVDKDLNVGDFIHIEGQLQSREYKRKNENDEIEIRVAHELSTAEIEKI